MAILIVSAWLACSVLTYGRTLAHFSTEYPRGRHRLFALAFALLGPGGLIVAMLKGKHGFKFTVSA